MSYKRSKAPTPEELEKGWLTDDAKDVALTFQTHGRLLLLFYKLGVIPAFAYNVIQKDFEQKTWSKIRDGDDYRWQ